nr:putative disease resistance protein rpp1 [Quercus suber]
MWIKETEEALPEEWLRNLISLRTLYLDKCPLPQGIRYLTALQHLEVKFSEVVDLVNDWDEMEWQGLRTLLSLQFYKLPKLVSLPMGLQYLNSLQNLEISFCPSLIAIPEWICKLISLQSLKIWHCPNLESLPEGIDALTSLQTLHILNCPKLESLPEGFGALISLQTLHISNCPNLESLPEGFGALTSLQTLYISNCPNLESLPEGFGALTSLQTLHILNCPKLESLPEGFGELSRPEEEPDEEEPEKPDHKNWDLIKAFGCCNCSTIQQLTHWNQLILQKWKGRNSKLPKLNPCLTAAAVSTSMAGRSKLASSPFATQPPAVGRKASDFSIARDGFGETCLILKHVDSGTKIHFNAFDAVTGWKQEALCPVKVTAAAKWKFRRLLSCTFI